MCCLFGMIDYKNSLTQRQQQRIISSLSVAAEERGTHAAGISYNTAKSLCIYKRPFPAHLMTFRLPRGTVAVMGHTRLATQGDQKRNCNNHPFYGKAGEEEFALAHNGVIFNDDILRITQRLPTSEVETDSYVAVQLIEKEKELSFESLKSVSEKLDGTFTITLLDREDNLYFIKGNNPMCIYHYPMKGIYLYASTEDILTAAIGRLGFKLGNAEKIPLLCGDILKIDRHGKTEREVFDTDRLFRRAQPFSVFGNYAPMMKDETEVKTDVDKEYLRDLKSVASNFGYSPVYVDALLDNGYTTEDVEEMLYYGDLLG